MRYWNVSLSVFAFVLQSQLTLAEVAGVAVDARRTVQSVGGANPRIIIARSEIFSNDHLRADSSGSAQIELVDKTKIVIGPGADLTIDDFVYSSSASIRTLTIKATKGAFRFISGNSSHDAYNIKTPQASIGVRGTAFDVTIRGSLTYLAVMEGSLRVCARSGACRVFDNRCDYIYVGGGDYGTRPMLSDKSIASLFPLIANQKHLRADFRRTPRSCAAVQLEPDNQTRQVQIAAVINWNNNDEVLQGIGNPGNGHTNGNAGEQPGLGGFGDDGVTGKGQR
jgi:hypothetical protein